MVNSVTSIEDAEKRFNARSSIREEHLQKLRANKWLEADTPDRVRKRLERLGRLELLDPRRVGDELKTSGDTDFLEVMFGENNLVSPRFLEAGLKLAAPVGRLHVRTPSGGILGWGTGFLVSQRLLLTNNHVIDNAESASRTLIEFNYQDGLEGQIMPSVIFNLQPEAFFVTNEELDYSLVAVKDTAANGSFLSAFGWVPLREEEVPVLVGECVNIIQHPNGGLKQLAIRENRVVDILDNFLHYDADTAAGGSGAPILNDQWELVGLHHKGFPKRDDQGRILTKEGTLWSAGMSEQRIDWLANEGININQIIQHIKKQDLSTDAQGSLRSAMFETKPS